ncbi:MAG TPA: ribosome biogenesis GTP-binding protein YihA/YsxC [Candidatus Obscuribacter sp.]|nr:ribosome biogenesis GTP-binding protein YihA/YsxC [Cyclobacteriaceae bacterium]HNN64151.1 ribosome biogenesis GTP-binding protein YihA/YsxC [Candidatus Obscuribacter sp.]
MHPLKAEFVKSSTTLDQCPPPRLPEFAFVGRSNVGKSSLINYLVGMKGLAKTSGKPGKTQTINHFTVDNRWYLVDLPGYGYAGVSQSQRHSWGKMLDQYLTHRENLRCTFVLVDARHAPQGSDLDFIQWLGGQGKPLAIILTKADKLSRSELAQSIRQHEDAMLQMWEELPDMFVTSSEKRVGREELLAFIDAAGK